MYKTTIVLAISSTAFLLFNMLSMLIFRQEIFIERDHILSAVEILILIGFGLIFLFNIVSCLWILLRIHSSENDFRGDKITLALGIFCLILLFGEKVMIDEIGREYQLEWEVLGEWIILYIFLTIQLFYNIIIFLQLYRTYTVRSLENNA